MSFTSLHLNHHALVMLMLNKNKIRHVSFILLTTTVVFVLPNVSKALGLY